MAEIEFLPLPSKSSSERGSDGTESSPATTAPHPTSTGDGAPATAQASSSPVIRPLTPDEIALHVLPDYAASGNPLPDPAISTFIGLFEGNRVSYLCLQVKLHAQPLVLRPGHEQFLRTLVHAAESHILSTVGPTWVYLFTPAGKLAQMAQTMGMQLEPWVVMSKLITPEPPQRPAFELIRPAPSDPGPFPDQDASYQSRPDDEAFESLFPGGVLPVDSSGRVQ